MVSQSVRTNVGQALLFWRGAVQLSIVALPCPVSCLLPVPPVWWPVSNCLWVRVSAPCWAAVAGGGEDGACAEGGAGAVPAGDLAGGGERGVAGALLRDGPATG